MSICELHNKEAELCESHIIPKFVYKWMKKTGTGRFRQIKVLNTPLQDGIKKAMLCKKCEGIFSKYETWFNREVFRPYLEDNNFEVENSKYLYSFSISVLWRVVKLFKDDGIKYKFKLLLNEAEKEWNKYLLFDKECRKFKNIHFLLIDNKYLLDKESDLYFSRGVDIDIIESEDSCLIYAKFAKFIIFGEIHGIVQGTFINTNLSEELILTSQNQEINDTSLFDFFDSRISQRLNFSDLSENQQKKNNIFFEKNREKILDSEYVEILKKYKS